MQRALRNCGLSIVLLALFLVSWIGQAVTGRREYNQSQQQHGQPALSLGEYLKSGHFWEATGENWESEFLQMAMFVVLTIALFQKGSAESKDPDSEHDSVDNDPRLSQNDPNAPWPVRKGGAMLWLYSNSLSITFVLLFLASFLIHAAGGAREFSSEQQEHGEAGVTMLQYMGTSRFWHESFQNWQSEFLSLAAMVILTIFLRQRGSPESKPVATPHMESGEDEPALVPVPVRGEKDHTPIGRPATA